MSDPTLAITGFMDLLEKVETAISLAEISVIYDFAGRQYTHVRNASEVARAILCMVASEESRDAPLNPKAPEVEALKLADAEFGEPLSAYRYRKLAEALSPPSPDAEALAGRLVEWADKLDRSSQIAGRNPEREGKTPRASDLIFKRADLLEAAALIRGSGR